MFNKVQKWCANRVGDAEKEGKVMTNLRKLSHTRILLIGLIAGALLGTFTAAWGFTTTSKPSSAKLASELESFVEHSIEAIDSILSLLEGEEGLIASMEYFERRVSEKEREMILDVVFTAFQKVIALIRVQPGDPFFVVPANLGIEQVKQGKDTKAILETLRANASKYNEEILEELKQVKSQSTGFSDQQIEAYIKDLEKRKQAHTFLESMVYHNKAWFHKARQWIQVGEFEEKVMKFLKGAAMVLAAVLIPPSWPALTATGSIAVISMLKKAEDLDHDTNIWMAALLAVSAAQSDMAYIYSNTVRGIKMIKGKEAPATPQGRVLWVEDVEIDHDKRLQQAGIMLSDRLGVEVYSLVNLFNLGKESANFKLLVLYVPHWGSIPVTVATEHRLEAGDNKQIKVNYTEALEREAITSGTPPQRLKIQQYKGNPPDAGDLLNVYVLARTPTGLYGIAKEMRLFTPKSLIPEQRPTISVSIREEIDEESCRRQPIDPAAETAVRQKLIGNGFRVVNAQANISVEGEGFGECIGQFDSFWQGRARLEVKVTETSTGRILVSEALHAGGIDVNPRIAAKRALQKAGERMGECIVKKLKQGWDTPCSFKAKAVGVHNFENDVSRGMKEMVEKALSKRGVQVVAPAAADIIVSGAITDYRVIYQIDIPIIGLIFRVGTVYMTVEPQILSLETAEIERGDEITEFAGGFEILGFKFGFGPKAVAKKISNRIADWVEFKVK